MSPLRFLMTLGLVAGLTACQDGAGSSSCGAGKNSGGFLDVGGGVINHSINVLASQSGKAVEFSNLLLQVADGDTFAAAPDGTPLAQSPLETGGCGEQGTQCPYCLSDTAISSARSQLLVVLRDSRTSGAQWVPAATGVSTAAHLDVLQAAGDPLDRTSSFAVTRDAVDRVLAPLAGISGEELLKRGAIFGLIYSTKEHSGERGVPVPDATVTPSASGVTVVYPNGNFSGPAGATTTQGVFVAVPSAAGSVKTTAFTVKGSAGTTWDTTRPGYFIPGVIYFHIMWAQ